MLKRLLIPAVAALVFVPQLLAAQAGANPPPESMHWRSGLTEINRGWAAHDGDNMAWAQPGLNDDAWDTENIEDMGAAQPGWHWYRRHVDAGPDNSDVSLLIEAGEGTYELYVNGERIPGPAITSSFGINRPIEHVFELSNDRGDFEIALRTYIPPSYHLFELPFCLSMTMGRPTAIEYERQSLESDRLYAVAPSVAINLLLVLAGIAVLALYTSQRTEREYLFLGLFLLLEGMLNAIWHLAQAGVLPASANMLLADPTTYFTCIAQVEFTFAFARRRVSRPWRIYECVVLLPILMAAPMWMGYISLNPYNVVQTCFIFPTAFMPVLLFLWYLRGNREAGWLIFPSLLPTIILSLYDLGQTSAFLGWRRFDFLDQPIPFGPIPLQTSDAGNLLFLLAIGVVMFFRFTRVSREQARSAAELDAARQIQRRLVPETLPVVAGYKIETAYLPAQEVGGDFYQVLEQADGATLAVIGDVSGKGLKAAMTGTLAIGALRALGAEGMGPAALLARLNEEMLRSQDGGFITCLCARVSRDGAVVIANAGHLSPYRGGEEIALDSGLPLGIAAQVEYAESAIRLKPGETLTLLSDGVLEARNAGGELFGFERMRAISGESAETIAQRAQQFGQEDDITVLTLEFSGAGAGVD
jgi:hypothetical protein